MLNQGLRELSIVLDRLRQERNFHIVRAMYGMTANAVDYVESIFQGEGVKYNKLEMSLESDNEMVAGAFLILAIFFKIYYIVIKLYIIMGFYLKILKL